MRKYSVRFDAYRDHGTGLTAEQQRRWLAESLDKVKSAILGSVPEWADSDEPGHNNLAVASNEAGDTLWIECGHPVDVESIGRAAMGRDWAYVNVHNFARGSIGFGQEIDPESVAYRDSKGDRLRHPTGGPLGWTKEGEEIRRRDFQIPI